jgi:transposase
MIVDEPALKRIEDLAKEIGRIGALLDALHALVDAQDIDDAMLTYEDRDEYTGRPTGEIDTRAIRELFDWPMADEAKAYYDKAQEKAIKAEPEEERTETHESETIEIEEESEEDPYGVIAAAQKIIEAGDKPKAGRPKIDREEVLQYAREGLSARWISEEMGIGLSSTNRILKELRDEGRLY